MCERDVPRTRCAEKDEMRDRHVTIATRSRVPLGVAVGMSLSTAAWVNHTPPSRAAGHPQRRCRSHALAPVVSQVDSTVESSLVALAAGFFLYVGLMEIIAKVSERGGSARAGTHLSRLCLGVIPQELVDYQTKGAGWFASLKLLMLLLGFSLMAMLAIWV